MALSKHWKMVGGSAAALISALALLAWRFSPGQEVPAAMVAEKGACGGDPQKVGKYESTWREDGSFILTTWVAHSSGSVPDPASAHAYWRASTLQLSYATARPQAGPKCEDIFKVTYQMRGLPKAEYEVEWLDWWRSDRYAGRRLSRIDHENR